MVALAEYSDPIRDYQDKVPYDPADFGLDPEVDETDQALVAMSYGDKFLLKYEIQLMELEQDHAGDYGIKLDRYYKDRDELYTAINLRRQELGIEERETPY